MTITEHNPTDQGPQIRLLICKTCGSIEELPDFEGRADDDDLLAISCERHTDALGTPHAGHLMKVPVKFWANESVKRQIIKQIREGVGGLDEFDASFYDTRSTFFEDAMSCYQKHLRPKGRCPDWMHESKKLVPKTAADRKEAGLAPPSKSPVHTYLCHFCPARAYMVRRAREEAGQYE